MYMYVCMCNCVYLFLVQEMHVDKYKSMYIDFVNIYNYMLTTTFMQAYIQTNKTKSNKFYNVILVKGITQFKFTLGTKCIR